MKKAKIVVNQAVKQNRLTTKKAVLVGLGVFAALGTVSVVVPTSNIPGFSYIAQAIGLNADATRSLTMADFAAYALGTKDNKISELRASNLSYRGSGNYGGGLAPFATLTADRLAEAYAKNAQEAREMEKSLGGQIKPFDKNALDKEYSIDPSIFGKGFDPTRLTGSSKAAYSGAMEALAAAAGQQAEAFGRPVKKEDLQSVANLVGLKDANISNIVGAGNILSLARKDDSTYDRVIKSARALSGTSVFGLINPELNRTDTRIGRPVYGLFKDLGNAFFFSRYAAGAKLPTAASDIAVAAFDGGSPQDQSLITGDETAQSPSVSEDPQFSLGQSAQSVNSCAEVKEAYNEILKTYYQSVQTLLDNMYDLKRKFGVDPITTPVPGFCVGNTNTNKPTKFAREIWNSFLDILENYCNTIRDTRINFANQCGITFEEPIKSCRYMAQSLQIARSRLGAMFKRCRNITPFGTQVVRINAAKFRRWDRKYNKYLRDGYTEDEASELADQDVPLTKDDLEGSFGVCDNQWECKNYVERRIEEAFAFGKIIDITSLPKKPR